MKRIWLIGAGGFAREVESHLGRENILGFLVDDRFRDLSDSRQFSLRRASEEVVLGSESTFLIAIGDPVVRERIVRSLPEQINYLRFIHETARMTGHDSKIGEGSIVCPFSAITTNVKIGRHAQLNISCVIGHDTTIGDFFTATPGVKVSGNCIIGDRVYMGANSCIREKISVCSDVVIGMGAVVVKDITEPGTYVGNPARKIK